PQARCWPLPGRWRAKGPGSRVRSTASSPPCGRPERAPSRAPLQAGTRVFESNSSVRPDMLGVSPTPSSGHRNAMGSLVLLDLMGGVALLLWGLHMVHSGIVRAFGSDLRRLLTVALGNRFTAFLAGAGVTVLLQSSTATGLMTASFAAGGLLALVPALAIMLGANVGTALIVQVLSFNVSAVAPVFFIVGVVAFKRGGRTRTR